MSMGALTDGTLVLHVDMDAFYAAVEQHDRPELIGRPVLVGGSSGRGVVTAASYEARRFGVHAPMPVSTALKRCPSAVCVRPRMLRYRDVSKQIFAVFHEVTPLVQGLSLDEAFLDVTGSVSLFGDARAIARHLKRRIRETTGLTASVGAAPNKLVAKIASAHGKPDGLVVVAPEGVQAFLDPLPVRRLPGFGGLRGARLERAGIGTLGELRRASDAVLWPLFGRHAPAIRARAAGIDRGRVRSERHPKSIGVQDTFEHDTADARALHRELARLSAAVCARLRRHRLTSARVGVRIRRADFRTFSRQSALVPPTADERTITRAANELLEDWLQAHGRQKLRLLGVVLSDLGTGAQLGLFGDTGERAQRVDAMVDGVRARFGTGALRRGSTLK
jgi:DNA polymerase IV